MQRLRIMTERPSTFVEPRFEHTALDAALDRHAQVFWLERENRRHTLHVEAERWANRHACAGYPRPRAERHDLHAASPRVPKEPRNVSWRGRAHHRQWPARGAHVFGVLFQ